MERFSKTVLLACALLTSLRIVASFFPEQRLWGLNLLYYVPPLARWIMVGIAILVLVSKVNRKLADMLALLFSRVAHSSGRLKGNLKYVLVSCLSFPLFWWLKERIYLLGDGNLRASEIVAGSNVSLTEPLDFLLHAWVFKITGLNAYDVYALLSCLAGVTFVYLALTFSNRLGESGEERFLAFCVLITMGANQLLFGYVESYTLMYVAAFAFVLFSWLYLQGRCSFWLPALMFLLATSLHLAGLTLLPALVYPSFAGMRRGKTEGRVALAAREPLWILALLLLVATGYWVLWSNTRSSAGLDAALLFPFGSLEKSLYPLYSVSHLLDFLNHQLLISPVGAVIWLVLILSGLRRTDVKSNITMFFLLLIAPQLLFAFLFNPQLGYPRDWDLFAFTSAGYTILGIHLLLRRFRLQEAKGIRYASLALAATALLSTLPWIYVNANQDKAIARFEHVLKLTPQRAALGHECLAYNYRRLGEQEEEVRQWIEAIRFSKKPRYVKNLAVVYVEMGQYGKAADKLEEVVKLDPDDHQTHSDLGKVYVMLGEEEAARVSFEKAIDLRPDNPQYYENLGLFLLNSGKFGESVEVFKKALQVRPDFVSHYRNLGLAHANSGDSDEAIKYLQSYLDYAPRAGDRIQIEKMIEQLKERTRRR